MTYYDVFLGTWYLGYLELSRRPSGCCCSSRSTSRRRFSR
jgi:hypothetical protein